jgi:hypothetical protein
MHVLGHEHVANEPEPEARTEVIEDLQKEIFGALGLKKGASLVATESDKVEVATAGAALQSSWHKKKSGSGTLLSALPEKRDASQRLHHPPV